MLELRIAFDHLDSANAELSQAIDAWRAEPKSRLRQRAYQAALARQLRAENFARKATRKPVSASCNGCSQTVQYIPTDVLAGSSVRCRACGYEVRLD